MFNGGREFKLIVIILLSLTLDLSEGGQTR